MIQDVIPRSRFSQGQPRPIAADHSQYHPRFDVVKPAPAARLVALDHLHYHQPRSIDGVYRKVTRITPTEVSVEETTVFFEPAPMTRPIEHLSAEDKMLVLQRALARAQVELRAERRSRRGLRHLTLEKTFA